MVLFYIAELVDYNGEVNLPALARERIAERVVKVDKKGNKKTGITPQTVTNIICKLTKKNILKVLKGTVYLLNPDLFAKGRWRDIREQRKAFQSITTYKPDGTKKVETVIVNDI